MYTACLEAEEKMAKRRDEWKLMIANLRKDDPK